MIEEVGGAPIKVLDEFEAIAKAMQGGDRVEYTVSRRGSKPGKVLVQYGKAKPVKEVVESKVDLSPIELKPAPVTRVQPNRYEPTVGSGLSSVYEGTEKPSSVLTPTPAPTRSNRVESLSEFDFPALDGGK